MTDAAALFAFLDESERAGIHFIGALLMTPPQAVSVEQRFDEICTMVSQQVSTFDPQTELHAWELFHGKTNWGSVPVPLRVRVSGLAIKAIADSGSRFILRGIHEDRLAAQYANPYPAHELALAHCLGAIQRLLTAENSPDVVFALADEHHTAPDSRTRFRQFRQVGGSGWVTEPLTSFIDTIYFGPSDHSRLLQAADLATFFTTRRLTITEQRPEAVKAMDGISASLSRFIVRCDTWPGNSLHWL